MDKDVKQLKERDSPSPDAEKTRKTNHHATRPANIKIVFLLVTHPENKCRAILMNEILLLIVH